jgi:hypothetical protein
MPFCLRQPVRLRTYPVGGVKHWMLHPMFEMNLISDSLMITAPYGMIRKDPINGLFRWHI